MAQRIYLVANDGSISNVHMPYALALQKLRNGEIDEVYEIQGVASSFKGIRLREAPTKPTESFHRGSLDQSVASITAAESEENAEAAAANKLTRARRKFLAWPTEHDSSTPVISAGTAYGVFCPLVPDNRVMSFA